MVSSMQKELYQMNGSQVCSLQDYGCTFPECKCEVPDWAFSEDNRKKFCKEYNREPDKEFWDMD